MRTGTRRSSPVSHTVTVDRSVSVSPGSLPAVTNNATAPLSFTYDSDVTSVSCSADGGPFTPCSSEWSYVTAATPADFAICATLALK